MPMSLTFYLLVAFPFLGSEHLLNEQFLKFVLCRASLSSSLKRFVTWGHWSNLDEVKLPTSSSLFSVVYRPPNANDLFIPFENVPEKAWFQSFNIFLEGDLDCDFTDILQVDALDSMNLNSKELPHLLNFYDMQNLICEQTRVTPTLSSLTI